MESTVGSQVGERGSRLWKAVGPGIIYAGAAIGVSHLVQSTRAGADYGFSLVWAVVLVNVCKYPFFEFAQRYAASTGESMLAGYRRVGWWALSAFLLVSFFSGMPTVAAVTLVAAGLASQIFAGGVPALAWSGILIVFCVALLGFGGYPWLDRLMKVMMVFLALCTGFAVVTAAVHGSNGEPTLAAPSVWEHSGIIFLLALMGWMPTPVDISAWPSLWMQERTKQTGHRPTLGEALFDFNLGYIATTVMAVMFLSLGALVMFGTGEKLETEASAFAGQLVRMYTATLGAWTRPFIMTAAFTCMLSTTITVIDGYPRVLAAGMAEFGAGTARPGRTWYWIFMVLLSGSAWGIIWYFSTRAGKMRALVDFVTVLAFLSAPLLALINWLALRKGRLPAAARPPRWLTGLSIAGMAFLICFSAIYVVDRLGVSSGDRSRAPVESVAPVAPAAESPSAGGSSRAEDDAP